MKLPKLPLLQVFILMLISNLTAATIPRSGFFMPDSMQVMTLKFKSVRDLIILPFTINDSVRVNLILDTGCRNLVLFGKKFQKLIPIDKSREVLFSGLGSGEAVKGHLSIMNKVTIEHVQGEHVPIVVVPDRNLFAGHNDVHGVIGYDIFLKFEIEINSQEKTITFRPAASAMPQPDYAKVPLEINDARPVMTSDIAFISKFSQSATLMIDTGSSLGLLLKTTDIKTFDNKLEETLIGRGLNGLLYGYKTTVSKLKLNGFEMSHLPAGIVQSPWHNYASIGMGVLKDYVVVLNYCKAYACFKKIA